MIDRPLVKVWAVLPLSVSDPNPDLVRPTEPAITVAVLLPKVALTLGATVMVGVVPFRVSVLAPEKI